MTSTVNASQLNIVGFVPFNYIAPEKNCVNPGCPQPNPQPCENFYLDPRNTSTGLSSWCMTCDRTRRRQDRNEEINFFKGMLHDSKRSIDRKNKKGKQMEHTLTLEQLMAKPRTCYYSGMVMSLQPHTTWKASPEKLDPKKGYTDDNVVLCCGEFNNQSNMTLEKFSTLYTDTVFNRKIFTSEHLYGPPRAASNKKWIHDTDTDTVFCHFCETAKPRNEFNQDLPGGCKSCNSIRKRGTWWKCAGRLIGYAKERCKRETTREGKICSIIKEDIINQLKVQGGLCAHSGYPLQLSGAFKVSLERIDVKRGYEQGNFCLICFEMQSSDCTAVKLEDSNDGHTGMNRDKFLYVLKDRIGDEAFEEYQAAVHKRDDAFACRLVMEDVLKGVENIVAEKERIKQLQEKEQAKKNKKSSKRKSTEQKGKPVKQPKLEK